MVTTYIVQLQPFWPIQCLRNSAAECLKNVYTYLLHSCCCSKGERLWIQDQTMKKPTRMRIHLIYFFLVAFIVFAGSASARHIHKEKAPPTGSTLARHLKKEKEAPADSTTATHIKKEKDAPTDSTSERHTKKENQALTVSISAIHPQKEKEAPTVSTPATHVKKRKKTPTESTPTKHAKKEEKTSEKRKSKHVKCGCEESRKTRRNQTCIAQG